VLILAPRRIAAGEPDTNTAVHGRARHFLVALAAVLAVAAVTPGAAFAQPTTIGNDLELSPNTEWVPCEDECTNSITNRAAEHTAAGGITVPFDGTIVTWRIRTGIPANGSSVASEAQPIRLWVLRPAAGGEFTFVAHSDTETLSTQVDVKQEFSTSLPVQEGDFFGLELLDPQASSAWTRVSGPNGDPEAEARFNQWDPTPAQGASEAPFVRQGEELLINADVEPSEVPRGGVDTGGGSAAKDDGPSLVPFAVAGLALLGALALFVRRRLTS